MRESDLSLDLRLQSPLSNPKEPTHLSQLHDFLRRLEEERLKIEAFKRELPLSLLLVDNAVFRLRQQAASKEISNDTDWLNHRQLWLPTHDVVGASFSKEAALLCATQCTNNGSEVKCLREKDERQRTRSKSNKPRRYWSQTLHRRFMIALENLGGSDAATPKQIREVMKIDGLSNDEVKSHLQKHRLRLGKHCSFKTKH